MKKLFRIVLVTVGALLLLLILVPILFKSRIERMVKDKVNQQIHATVDWSGFSLSLFRGFPDLSINLRQFSLVGKEPFEGDTLAGLQRFELRVNPFGAFRDHMVVRSILLERPLINAIVLEDGEVNWDILTSAGGEETEEEAGTPMKVSLKRLAISGGRIYYSDSSSHLNAALEGFNLEMRGDLSLEQTDLKISSAIERINLKSGGVRYLKDAVFNLDLVTEANMMENRYTLRESMITLNGLLLGVEGEVLLPDDGSIRMNLDYFTRETSFQTLLSLVPAVYLNDFNSLKSSGTIQLEGVVSGVMKDSIMPDATMHLQVNDGYFSYPDLPKDVSDVQVSLNIDYQGSDPDASRFDLENFHLLLGGNPFDLSMKVDHPFSDMHVSGRAGGSIDLGSISEVVPLEDISLEGKLKTDLRWDTRMSSIEDEQYEEVDLEGSLQVEGMTVETPDLPVPVSIEEMNMLFNPRRVELAALNMRMGRSDLHLNGELGNFIPYVFTGETISGRLNVSSTLLDANELLLPDNVTGTEAVSDTLVPVPPDSLAEPFNIRIPENIDFTAELDMRRVEYKKVTVENIKGKMRITGGVAGLDELHMDLTGGSMTASGWLDTRNKYAETDLSVEMENVDISSATGSFVSLGRLAPMADLCRGKANVNMQYHSLMDQTLVPLFGSIDARGRVSTNDLQFHNLEDFIHFSEFLQNDRFNEMVPDKVNLSFTVRDGRVIFTPFQMKVDHSLFNVSGSHGIDLTMDYILDMQIAKADLGEGVNEMMQGVALLAAGAGLRVPPSDYIKVKAHITGTFNHPKLSTDLSGNLRSAGETVQEAVKEKINEEVNRVEEQVKEEVSSQAEKIIAEAEAEAALLVDEAVKAGEALVKAADAQGARLMEEAGNNPLKQVAARQAAQELKRQAEKQSEDLVNEAEAKAADLIRKAREKAAEL